MANFYSLLARFNKMKACDDTYYVTVIEDLRTGQIIGSATLVKEQKFIHRASSVRRIYLLLLFS